MGYEATRFTDKVDEEFFCSICAMVLEDPMQSPCEHLFCSECIKGWLSVVQFCPVERGPLQLEDLKPALRTVRNLMNKFEIKCDFESKGCAAIVKLENLEDHVGRCEYNPNATVICDKGCDIEIRREEYETKNCFKHLAEQAVRHQEEIKNLNDQVSLQNEKIKKQNDEVISLREELVNLREEVIGIRNETRRQQEDSVNQMIRQNDEIATLNDQVQKQSTEIQRLNDELNCKGDTISRLNLNELRFEESSKSSKGTSTKVLVSEQPEFRCYNVKIRIDQPNVLEVDNGEGSAQSLYSLEQTKFSFKIEILSLGRWIIIGLAPIGPSNGKHPFGVGTVSYWNDGRFIFDEKYDEKYTKNLEEWKAGDIIECGINFPIDFVIDGRRVQVYFKLNGKLKAENLIDMPMDGFFPTVDMHKGSKIRYLKN